MPGESKPVRRVEGHYPPGLALCAVHVKLIPPPADLWLDNVELAEVLDENGDVDPALVALGVKRVLDGRPQLAPQVGDDGAGRRAAIGGTSANWGRRTRRT